VVKMKDTVYENDISDELEPFSEDSRKDSILIPIKGKGIYIKQLPLYVLCNYETEEATVTEKKMTNPKMMTVKEVAETGVLSEYALRQLIKEDRLPVLRIGNRALINYERLIEDLNVLRLKDAGDSQDE